MCACVHVRMHVCMGTGRVGLVCGEWRRVIGESCEGFVIGEYEKEIGCAVSTLGGGDQVAELITL